mmetsp:Transcript_123026/g.383002  ORF Transcript_123026/g.383002 Transcript_123026/m.383002 type:complete len:278 (-) Transcript_123026:74-907(-)
MVSYSRVMDIWSRRCLEARSSMSLSISTPPTGLPSFKSRILPKRHAAGLGAASSTAQRPFMSSSKEAWRPARTPFRLAVRPSLSLKRSASSLTFGWSSAASPPADDSLPKDGNGFSGSWREGGWLAEGDDPGPCAHTLGEGLVALPIGTRPGAGPVALPRPPPRMGPPFPSSFFWKASGTIGLTTPAGRGKSPLGPPLLNSVVTGLGAVRPGPEQSLGMMGPRETPPSNLGTEGLVGKVLKPPPPAPRKETGRMGPPFPPGGPQAPLKGQPPFCWNP